MIDTNINIKKKIIYQLSYSGTKETDILYKRMIIDRLEIFNKKELILLSNLLNEISDTEIFKILTKKLNLPKKYKKILDKIIYEEKK
tara:strand:- start:49 stop:309 length:261 start_codon:yes stop_codon:yes gene_type:complete